MKRRDFLVMGGATEPIAAALKESYAPDMPLAEAIGDCLDHPEKLDRYRHNGLRHAASKHGFDDYAQRHLDLYQELAKESRHGS